MNFINKVLLQKFLSREMKIANTSTISIGKGKSLSNSLDDMQMIVEGVETTKSVYFISKKNNISMPICNEVYNILFNNKNPQRAIDELMSRELKSDPDSGEKAAWDELLVNKFKIKKVHVGEEYAPDFEGDKDIHGLPIQTWDSNNDLAKHISSIVKKKR